MFFEGSVVCVVDLLELRGLFPGSVLWSLKQMNINNLKGADLPYSLFHCSLLPSTGFRRACTRTRAHTARLIKW